MSFISVPFVALFLATLIAYHFCHRSVRLQNCVVLIASLVFYGWWSVNFLTLLIAFTVANYLAGLGIERFPDRKRIIVWTIVTANLALLGYFKYANFFISDFASLVTAIGFSASVPTLEIILPLGISFFVFQKIAYVVDVYRGDISAERSLLVFLCFVLFFPQLVAGPIERADHLLPQFKKERQLSIEKIQQAIFLICWGLFLKIAVADSLAPLADNAFRTDQQYGWSVLLGTIAFGFQIYGDFCGYSMMAKGLAALLGFDLVWNFQQPYFSKNIQEFWQRWHISLGRWLRDYVYIPLGGNRVGYLRTQNNLLVTMALGGLWHGASWTFVMWGVLHGIALAIHRLWSARFKLPDIAAWLLTMVVVFAGWFLFRVQTMDMLYPMLSSVHDMGWRPGHTEVLVMILALITPVFLIEWLQVRAGFFALIEHSPQLAAVANAIAVVAALALIGNVRSQFVYFQF